MDSELTIFYYIDLFRKWKKTFLIVIITASLLSMAVSLVRPVKYVSTVTLLLTGDSASGSSSVARLLGIPDVTGSSKEIIVAILKSRRMASDIRKEFDLKKSKKRWFVIKTPSMAWWRINTYPMIAGLAVSVEGADPEITQKVADFCIQNLDKINMELHITPAKPMVTVLDPAGYGDPEERHTLRKMLIAAIFSFIVLGLFIVVSDYLKRLKKT